jgi:hypothetical protein
MPAGSSSPNTAHNATVATALSVCQSAIVPGASQATVMSADIVFYRACLASAIARNCGTSGYLMALKALGVGA